MYLVDLLYPVCATNKTQTAQYIVSNSEDLALDDVQKLCINSTSVNSTKLSIWSIVPFKRCCSIIVLAKLSASVGDKSNKAPNCTNVILLYNLDAAKRLCSITEFCNT